MLVGRRGLISGGRGLSRVGGACGPSPPPGARGAARRGGVPHPGAVQLGAARLGTALLGSARPAWSWGRRWCWRCCCARLPVSHRRRGVPGRSRPQPRNLPGMPASGARGCAGRGGRLPARHCLLATHRGRPRTGGPSPCCPQVMLGLGVAEWGQPGGGSASGPGGFASEATGGSGNGVKENAPGCVGASVPSKMH